MMLLLFWRKEAAADVGEAVTARILVAVGGPLRSQDCPQVVRSLSAPSKAREFIV